MYKSICAWVAGAAWVSVFLLIWALILLPTDDHFSFDVWMLICLVVIAMVATGEVR